MQSVRFSHQLGNAMKIRIALSVPLLFLFFCVEAAAQFSQPPPNRSAPICSLEKKFPAGEPVSSGCPKIGIVSSSSPYLQCSYSSGYVYCTTNTWVYVDGSLVEIDHSSAIHDWAYIVDGQEYYWDPVNQGSIWIDCGNSRRGFVRVAVLGGVRQQSFECSAPVANPW
jgi:hypothetical protein